MPRLYTYILPYDTGFAPNPFHGFCTLATCKPIIRRKAKIEDWIAGTGSKQKGQDGHLVFAMRVDEIPSFDEYWSDRRFQGKKPSRVGSLEQKSGDNIYHRDPDKKSWIQEPGFHSLADGCPDMNHVKRDTRYPRVLISKSFVYYGHNAIEIPYVYRDWEGSDVCASSQGYRCNFAEDLRDDFVNWLASQVHIGIAGEPTDRQTCSPGKLCGSGSGLVGGHHNAGSSTCTPSARRGP